MLTLEEIKKKLAYSNLSEVSRLSGIPYGTIYRLIKGGEPSYNTVKALSDFLESDLNVSN